MAPGGSSRAQKPRTARRVRLRHKGTRSCCFPLGALASALCVFFLLALAPSQAQASPAGALWSGPVLPEGSRLRVASEAVSFVCSGPPAKATCAVESHSVLQNLGTESVSETVVFYALNSEDTVHKIDGLAASPIKVDPAIVFSQIDAPDMGFLRAEEAVRTGASVKVPAGGRVEIVTTCKLLLTGGIPQDLPLTIPALAARHPLLHTGEMNDVLRLVQYLASPVSTWGDGHELTVRVHRPSSWALFGDLLFRGESEERTAVTRSESASGSDTEVTFAHKGHPPARSRAALARLSFEVPNPLPLHGGPFVAVGGTLGRGVDLEGIRARVGYEIAAPRWLFESLSLESDFRRRVVLTPAVEAMTPQLFFIPALGLGVGVPVQLAPKATVGARIQASAQIFFVGLTVTVDIYPGLQPYEGVVQTSVMGRVSL